MDWGDGTGLHLAQVTGNTITADLAAPSAPGTYYPQILLYDCDADFVNTVNRPGAPGPIASTSSPVYVWGVVINNGVNDDLLMASSDGTQNLQAVTVYFPDPTGEALDLTLTTSDNNEDDLWTTPSPNLDPNAGTVDVPVLGNGASTYTFTADAGIATFWVGATQGDTMLNVLHYDINGLYDYGDSTNAFKAAVTNGTVTPSAGVEGASGPMGATDCASDLSVRISLDYDANTDPGADGTANKPYNWLVGQTVAMTATVSKGQPEFIDKGDLRFGPFQETMPDSYNDSGRVRVRSSMPGIMSFMTANAQGNVGLQETFYWISTQYDPSKVAGPDHDVVTLSMKSWADPTITGSANIAFNVFSPTTSGANNAPTPIVVPGVVGLDDTDLQPEAPEPPIHGLATFSKTLSVGLNGDPTNKASPQVGITWGAAVSTPQPGRRGCVLDRQLQIHSIDHPFQYVHSYWRRPIQIKGLQSTGA